VVLVGTCPGGTASNVITFISKGDLALSVTMTTVSTLLSPIMTPLLTYMIIGQRIDFSPIAMFWSIVQIVIIPIGFGVALRHCFPDWCEKAKAYLPALSCLCISLLIAGLAGASRDAILASSATIMAVVVLHNLLGSALGFAIGRISGMSWKKCVALSIEVGMQNSGLAAGLAKTHFPALAAAAVPGAIFSSWHNISGSILAWLYVNYLNPRFDEELQGNVNTISGKPSTAH
jgi:BASS family bile acid:Na+ symporter